MILYPAIDIRGGKAVRLMQGDYERETVYDDSPADAARRWAEGGAEWLHVVDLDGARAGGPVNLPAIEAIAAAVDCEMLGCRNCLEVARVVPLHPADELHGQLAG